MPGLHQLVELMRETMRDAPGVGLAAPQVGLPLQLAVIEDAPRRRRAARSRAGPVPRHHQPAPHARATSASSFFEGCLSVDGFRRSCRARAPCASTRSTRAGSRVSIDAPGWYARILQHEIDHLGGTLYIDRMRTRTLTTARNAARHLAGSHRGVAGPVGRKVIWPAPKARGGQLGHLAAAEAANQVIVDQPAGLHERVDDRRAHEAEATLFQLARQSVRQRRARQNVGASPAGPTNRAAHPRIARSRRRTSPRPQPAPGRRARW